MSWEATNWALYAPCGGNLKVVLLGLANHADPDGADAYPAVERLAVYADCDRTTVRRNLRKLEAMGLITAVGTAPDGQVRYELHMDVQGGQKTRAGKTPSRAPAPAGEGASALRTTHNGPKGGASAQARARERARQIPADFPDGLRPHAREVMRVLRTVAEQHAAREVTALAVARVCMGYPRHPLVTAAHDFASWAADPPRPIRDVVGSYRTWLKRERPLATTERLEGGTAAAGPAPQPVGVVPLRRNASAEERRMERQRRRLAVAQQAQEAAGVQAQLTAGQ